jgi:hypothetical protein
MVRLTLLSLLLASSCTRWQMHEFKMGHHKVKTDGRVHPNYEAKRKKVFVAPMRETFDIRNPQFKLFSNYTYTALEERGHKRTYNPREADLVVLLDYKRSGPHRIQRTAVNHFWTNYSPFLDNFFLNKVNKINAESTYAFLKKRRDIKNWKEEKDAFNHYYYVYLTRVKIRAVEYIKDQEPRIAWENTITALGQKKRFAAGFIAAIAASFKHWEKEIENPYYTDLVHRDPQIFRLYEKVVAENAYQTAEKHQRFREDYRHLSNEELLKYYVRRSRNVDLNPLYKPTPGTIIPIIENGGSEEDDGYFRN